MQRPSELGSAIESCSAQPCSSSWWENRRFDSAVTLPDCFDALRRRLERTPDGLGTREFIRVLRLLEQASLSELTAAVEYAFDLDAVDAESIRVILEHRRESPVALFSLDGRPRLKLVHVPSTDIAAYGAVLAPGVIA